MVKFNYKGKDNTVDWLSKEELEPVKSLWDRKKGGGRLHTARHGPVCRGIHPSPFCRTYFWDRRWLSTGVNNPVYRDISKLWVLIQFGTKRCSSSKGKFQNRCMTHGSCLFIWIGLKTRRRTLGFRTNSLENGWILIMDPCWRKPWPRLVVEDWWPSHLPFARRELRSRTNTMSL